MIKQHIPNALTSLNLAAGMVGILFVLDGQIEYGAYMIFLAAIFDFLDGFVARMLKVSGELGKQLDSLADMVTFGVLPAFILFSMIESNTENVYLPYAAFLIGIFSALRLAKFNIDERQSDRFIGVPTPANALLISTLPFLAEKSPFFESLLSNPIFLVGLGLVMSFLLVAELPLIALKFKDFSFSKNIFRYLVLGTSLISLILLGIAGIPFAIILYIALSFIEAVITRNA
ncbi:CDP-diacylglycerol--serine O-phosphatidyltransferase [Aquiflexum sp. TKW24L]|uniref:CDP-diacylglycerol--serine O-phosphatidyltransferase n=1 Tax=Aquiflexum sp. TKW24L TaxID=2942212 RepID=UPI0020BD874E|nr:CDP-diacylglycerol--serine O-phosphatidyltransferase [Aquiflexum sp. TKW24L]MCL6260335.1 CDP-diacylglycerol--serine O-phosphatidyltransferase [Aquiflexum sp. TKW24L]